MPVNVSMPMAVPHAGEDPLVFYSSFAPNLEVSWIPGKGFVVRVAADPKFARLHAPLKAAMRFVPAGVPLTGGEVLETDTLVLQTWPVGLLALREELLVPPPAQIRFENVDTTELRTAVESLYSEINRSKAAADRFMEGGGLLRVKAGTAIGAASIAPANASTSPLPNLVVIRFVSAAGIELNPVSMLKAFADAAQVDNASHPLLSKVGTNDWIEIIVTNGNGIPLANEPYTIYFADGSDRSGLTDSEGRIYEEAVPAGNWALDIPNHPSFTLL